MKILQINAVSRIRSTGRLSAEIADYLNANGHNGYMAYSAGVPYTKGCQIGTKAEIKLHAFLSRLTGLQGYYSKRGTKKLIRYMEELKPDAVHLENLHANYINLRLLLGYLAKNDIPTVLTLWDCWFFTGKCSHFTVDNCYKWKTECGQCPRVKKDNRSWFFDRTKKMREDKKKWFNDIPRLAVVGVSDWITCEAKQSILQSSKIIRRIYNWVDLDVFEPMDTENLRKKLRFENRFIILGVASSWTNSKGLGSFLELAKIIQDDMRIILVGEMSSPVKIPCNIIHIEETNNVKEMVEFYSMADVLVNLSIEETFGLVTAEALACGTPAVVINSTANPELVGEGCGFISDTGNASEIMPYIQTIKAAGKNCYTENCRKYAKENFLKDDRIRDYIDVYYEISKIVKKNL